MRFDVLATVAGSLLFASSGIAAPPASAPQVWQVDWEGSRCSISTGDPASVFLALWMTPGDPRPELYIVAPSERFNGAADKVSVTLNPGAKGFESKSTVKLGKAGASILQVFDLREPFPPAFARASDVRISGGLKTPIVISVIGADQAMVALQKCLDEKLPEWGIDAKAYNALRSPPLDTDLLDWISADDYPERAQANNEAGDVVARVAVNAKGKVTDCAVVSSSGSEPLDKVTCSKLLKNGHFIPAVGANGKPAAGVRTLRVKFRLESI